MFANAIESTLLIVLIQLCVIIAAARVFGSMFRKLGQPIVVGEILAGLILGPLLLSTFAPDVSELVFPTNPDDPNSAIVGNSFQVLSQIGLIFLLFLIGL